MAKRSRPIRATRRNGGFLRGLALGLAVATVVQLHHAGLPDWLGGGPEDVAEPRSPIEPSNTNFDFYRLLPKTEVQVDESDLPGTAPAPAQAPPPAQRTVNRPAAGSGRETIASAPARGGFRVQVGSFRSRNEADRLRASLALNGFESRILTRDTADGTWHRVMLGPFSGRAAAEEAKARVSASRGIDARIVPEES
ncbi:MAG: SPOR domain-containing protein [Immundisolibacterales bacterium]|nr:SPOR domain-containing protein [Immundisolibacterales bacterium]